MKGVLLASALLLSACSDTSFTIVTVDARPAVVGATSLRVTLSNGGSMRSDDFPLDTDQSLPLTFSISAPSRSGDLGITVEGVDRDDLVVGRGTTTAKVADPTATVLLDTTDFVVNDDVEGDQEPDDDYEAHGFQIASASDGTWLVSYVDQSGGGYRIAGRKFDSLGQPAETRAAAGTRSFTLNSSPTESTATPAIATAGTSAIAVWDFSEPSPSTVTGIACRSIDADGMLSTAQVAPNLDSGTDVVTTTALSNENFAVTWGNFTTQQAIRAMIVKPDCTVLTGSTITLSTGPATDNPRRPAVASNNGKIMYAWWVDGNVHVRVTDNSNGNASTDTQFLPKTATQEIDSVRVAPLLDGFAVFVRWGVGTAPGDKPRIDMYKTGPTGAVIGQAINVTTKTTTVEFDNPQAFGVAERSDGVLFVTWHACGDDGDGQGCGVFGRALDSSGAPLTDELRIPTTTVGDQTGPSVAPLGTDAFVVTWRDASAQQPDASMHAARARILYVP
ncbi:MAG TPA: hypothetical protein VGM90_38830 [Kofleriaceae bacterium]|jgi:hypothetical protein